MKPGDPKSIERMFNDIAPNYDLLNDFLSFGLHRVWKRKLLKLVSPRRGEVWGDLCCGTGDMAFELARILKPSGKVFAIDYAESILNIGKRRLSKEPFLGINWIHQNVLNTNFPSDYFDGIVMSFGLRNIGSPYLAFSEIRRILKPGGRVGILDFNHINDNYVQSLFQKIYLRKIVVPISSCFGLSKHYSYIEKSLLDFPCGLEQEKLAKDAGFRKVSFQKIAFGQMGILFLML